MAKTADKNVDKEVDPEIEYLKEKSKKGALNVVGDILGDPEVQKVIKKALTREVISQTLIMSCLFIGILKIYDVGKQVLGFGWQVELVISIILISVGLIYMLKNLFNGKKNGH